MKMTFAFGLIISFGSALHAQAINVRGKVTNSAGQPVANASVELVQQGLKAATGADGSYSLIKPSVSNHSASTALTEDVRLNRGILEFTVAQPSPMKVEVFDMKGNCRKKEMITNAQPGVYHLDIASIPYSEQMLIVQASIGGLVRTFRYFPSRKEIAEGNFTIASARSASGTLAKMAAVVDSLNVTAVGYSPKRIALASYDTTVNVTLIDATAVYNPCPTNGNPCKLLPFGDSITQGAASSDNAGYRTPLFKLIVAAKQKATFVGSQSSGPTTVSGVAFPRTHEGHPGWRIGGGGTSGIYTLIPSPALNDNPHIILLLIGANDIYNPGADGMAARLEGLLDKLTQAAPTSLIVLATMTSIGPVERGATPAEVTAAHAAMEVYNSKMPGMIQAHTAKGHHIIGVDMSKLPVSYLTPGSKHPTDKGYAYMADIWYPAIKDLLPK